MAASRLASGHACRQCALSRRPATRRRLARVAGQPQALPGRGPSPALRPERGRDPAPLRRGAGVDSDRSPLGLRRRSGSRRERGSPRPGPMARRQRQALSGAGPVRSRPAGAKAPGAAGPRSSLRPRCLATAPGIDFRSPSRSPRSPSASRWARPILGMDGTFDRRPGRCRCATSRSRCRRRPAGRSAFAALQQEVERHGGLGRLAVQRRDLAVDDGQFRLRLRLHVRPLLLGPRSA